MPEQTGAARPGGRTARIREAVHDAKRELLAEPGAEITISAIAARSGVHTTTIYRRWRTADSIVLDLAVEQVTDNTPIPATGDLRADLISYTSRLLFGLQRAGSSTFLQTLLAASATAREDGSGLDDIARIVEPRIQQFQAMLDAAGATRVDGLRLVELLLAPAYLWAQLGVPLDPARDTQRLVEAVLTLAE